MSKLLEVKGITKNYHDAPGSRNIISDLDLTVEKGDFLCILGPSGWQDDADTLHRGL